MDTQNDNTERLLKVNMLSVLIPAKSYKLKCSWTKEKTLPAIEDFSCRLLLMFEELSASEIQHYFGLSNREREVLIETLINNRLVTLDGKGLLKPTPLLARQGETLSNGTSLVEYEERNETAIFDLLTQQLMRRRTLDSSRFGLPEVSVEGSTSLSNEDVVKCFSGQYRAHLEFTRGNIKEAQKTKLYKITSISPDKVTQIPVDIEVKVELTHDGKLKVYRNAMEKIGALRHSPLSNLLEARVADFFASLSCEDDEGDFQAFCDLTNDHVLPQFTDAGEFDFTRWLSARHKKKTGYGSSDTTAMIGPVYLLENRTAIIQKLKSARKEWQPDVIKSALWFGADVPLWAASGEEVAEFGRRLESELCDSGDEKGRLSAILCFEHDDFKGKKHYFKDKYRHRVPNGIGVAAEFPTKRMEFFIIPGVLAVCQYNVSLSKNSGITFPIGHITTCPSRCEKLTHMLMDRYLSSELVKLWSRRDLKINQLLGPELCAELREGARLKHD